MERSSTVRTPTLNKPGHTLSITHTQSVVRCTSRLLFGLGNSGLKTQNLKFCAPAMSSRNSGLRGTRRPVGYCSRRSNKRCRPNYLCISIAPIYTMLVFSFMRRVENYISSALSILTTTLSMYMVRPGNSPLRMLDRIPEPQHLSYRPIKYNRTLFHVSLLSA
jgi:hypothetical protein